MPEINIGQQSVDQNLGVDLGFACLVHGLQIYTDRPSGAGVSWTVFSSADNLIWREVPGSIKTEFNTSFSRYEILFSPVNTRYLKAVQGGLNDVLTVLVAEIEALEETSKADDDTRARTSHLTNAAVSYRFSEKVRSTVDIQYRTEPASDFNNSLDQLFYGFSTRYTPGTVITQTISYQAGWEKYRGGLAELSRATLSYVMTAAPLMTSQSPLRRV